MTRKSRSHRSAAVAAQRARDAAAQVVPMAKSAVPMAKSAAKQSAEDAVAWAAPLVKDARAWAAPHVEQAGLAVRDKIAPVISDALVEAAHRLDDTAPRRRRWPRVVAGIAGLAAARSAIAAAGLPRPAPAMDSRPPGPPRGLRQATDANSPERPTPHRDNGLPPRIGPSMYRWWRPGATIGTFTRRDVMGVRFE